MGHQLAPAPYVLLLPNNLGLSGQGVLDYNSKSPGSGADTEIAIRMPTALIGSDKCPRVYLAQYLKAGLWSFLATCAGFWMVWLDGTMPSAWWMIALFTGLAGMVSTRVVVDEVHFQGAWPLEDKMR
jgi:hypothetical protein